MGHGCHDCGSPNSCECNTLTKPAPVERSVINRAEALELVYLYAKDILAFWPQFSFKTVPIMMKKMDALKQAIEAVK